MSRIAWFISIWCASVAVLALVAYGIKMVLL